MTHFPDSSKRWGRGPSYSFLYTKSRSRCKPKHCTFPLHCSNSFYSHFRREIYEIAGRLESAKNTWKGDRNWNIEMKGHRILQDCKKKTYQFSTALAAKNSHFLPLFCTSQLVMLSLQDRRHFPEQWTLGATRDYYLLNSPLALHNNQFPT